MTEGEGRDQGSFAGLEPGKALNHMSVQAIEAFKLLTMTAEGRRAFLLAPARERKQEAFDKLFHPDLEDEERLPDEQTQRHDVQQLGRRDVKYEQIPRGVRDVLEELSDSELALLADLDAACVKAGMSVESNPGGSHVY